MIRLHDVNKSKQEEIPKIKGLGDVVAKVAEPIATVIDKVFHTHIKGCSTCAKRRKKLNDLVSF
jgi:hypothetical protein